MSALAKSRRLLSPPSGVWPRPVRLGPGAALSGNFAWAGGLTCPRAGQYRFTPASGTVSIHGGERSSLMKTIWIALRAWAAVGVLGVALAAGPEAALRVTDSRSRVSGDHAVT